MWAASSRTAARSGSMASTSGKGEGAVIIAPLEYQTCVRLSSSSFRQFCRDRSTLSSNACKRHEYVTAFPVPEQDAKQRRTRLPAYGTVWCSPLWRLAGVRPFDPDSAGTGELLLPDRHRLLQPV